MWKQGKELWAADLLQASCSTLEGSVAPRLVTPNRHSRGGNVHLHEALSRDPKRLAQAAAPLHAGDESVHSVAGRAPKGAADGDPAAHLQRGGVSKGGASEQAASQGVLHEARGLSFSGHCNAYFRTSTSHKKQGPPRIPTCPSILARKHSHTHQSFELGGVVGQQGADHQAAHGVRHQVDAGARAALRHLLQRSRGAGQWGCVTWASQGVGKCIPHLELSSLQMRCTPGSAGSPPAACRPAGGAAAPRR